MIHKTAIIDPKAKISSSANIGAYTIIGPNVEIDEDTIVQSHVSIVGHTKIGKKNNIYPFASIGNDPQDLKFKGEETTTVIGNNTTIRECVTINRGTKHSNTTIVGDNCFLMAPNAHSLQPEGHWSGGRPGA